MRFVTYTTVLLSALATVSAYPVSSFFPFGQAQGNWQAGRNDDGAFGPWQFPAGATFPVYGTIQNQISIGNNGIINFASPISTFTPQAFPLNIGPAFTPFWADVDTRGTTGVVGPDENMLSVGFYAAAAAPGGSGTNNVFKPIPQGITDKFRSITDQAFPNEATFTPNLVVVATWDRVGYYSAKLNKRNTFQAVMGSDGIRSFVCFEYARLEWTTGDASGGNNGLGGTSVNAGFNNGNGQFTSLTTNNVPPPLDAQLGLMANSNVGQPGLYCWSVAGSVVRPAEADIDGDPQFAGFQGQQFQFHGLADEHFNLISAPQLQLNSHFVYLSSGNCNYNNTLCYQHPGTYLDVLGLTIPSVSGTAAAAAGDVRIKLVAGAHSEGLRVWMSQAESGVETEIKLGAYPRGLTWEMDADGNKATLKYNQFGQVSIKTPMFDINVVNSDFFFNLGLSLLDAEMLHVGRKKHTITDHSICNHDKHGHAHVDEKDETLAHVTHDHGMVEGELMKKYHVTYPLHGLIGQTWRNVRVCGKDWMGRVNDYVVSSLFGGDYYYNFYKSNSNNNVTQAHA